MKIAINGNIINVKHIYNITEILLSNPSKPIDNYSNGYYFIIKFINKKELFIYFENKWLYEKDIDDSEKDKLKIKEFRDSIIKIWSENQSDIPQFNL